MELFNDRVKCWGFILLRTTGARVLGFEDEERHDGCETSGIGKLCSLAWRERDGVKRTGWDQKRQWKLQKKG